MTRTKRIFTIGALFGLLAATFAVLAATPTVSAQSATGWSGSGSAVLLDVDAPTPGIDVASVPLSPVSSSVDADGTPNAVAEAANLDAHALEALPLDGILTQAYQEAPPDNAEPDVDFTIEEIPLEPLLNLGVSESSAHARWFESGECPASGDPITTAYNETAGADVLIPGDFPVVTVTDDAGGVSATQNSISLTGDGNIRGLTSESYTQLAGIRLLEGTPLGLNISVADVPTITASADGTPGGATTSHNLEDLVTITALDGSSLGPLEDLGDALNDLVVDTVLDAVAGDALESLVAEVLGILGDPVTLELTVGDDTVEQSVAADGTSASITGAVLDIRIGVLDNYSSEGLGAGLELAYDLLITVLESLGLGPISASVELGRMTAHAQVPQGGIDCTGDDGENPLRDAHKDATQAEVAPGGTFDYTLTVPNRGECVLTDVVLTDVVTGPEGTVVTADPAPDSQDGLTLVWNIGELQPNETRTFTLTVQVPEDAPIGATYTNNMHVEGDCDGVPAEREVDYEGPTVSDAFQGPCNLGSSNKAASHLEVMPGQTFNYFIHVFNQGAEPCTDISVFDMLDEQVSFVACTHDCTQEGQAVVWDGLSVGPGSGLTLTITVQNDAEVGSTLSNVAVIDSPDDPTGPHEVSWTGPAVTDQSVLAPPNPARIGEIDELPRTGGNNLLLPVVLVGSALLMGLAIRRRFVL